MGWPPRWSWDGHVLAGEDVRECQMWRGVKHRCRGAAEQEEQLILSSVSRVGQARVGDNKLNKMVVERILNILNTKEKV